MTARRLLSSLAAVALAAIVVVSLMTASHSAAPTVQQRAHRLDGQLRCPVCQGLSVADSPSSTSQAIAADVQRRVEAGQTDDQIRSYYVDRYGSWILLSPSGGGSQLVWLVPVLALGAALALLTVALRRWTRRPEPVLTPDDEALVARERGRRRLPQPELEHR
jgi:cytochrome c-type biogenesis protein CcmH